MDNKDFFLKVALTGGAGSGKSLVSKRLRELGVATVDSDYLARQAVVPESSGLKRIVRRFGASVLLENGELNRSKLRDIIINDFEAKRELERIVHPEVFRLMDEAVLRARSSCKPSIVIEIPLLFESGLEKEFDLIVAVSLKREIQLERLTQRDSVTLEGARALLNAQLSDGARVSRSDYVIENNGSVEELIKKVDIFHVERLKS